MKKTSTGHLISKNGRHVKQIGEISKSMYIGSCVKENGIYYYYYTGRRLGEFIYSI